MLIWCRVGGFASHAVRLAHWAVVRGYSHIEDLLLAVPDDLALAIGLPRKVGFLLEPAIRDLGRLRLSDNARERSTRWAVFAPLERGPIVSGTSTAFLGAIWTGAVFQMSVTDIVCEFGMGSIATLLIDLALKTCVVHASELPQHLLGPHKLDNLGLDRHADRVLRSTPCRWATGASALAQGCSEWPVAVCGKVTWSRCNSTQMVGTVTWM